MRRPTLPALLAATLALAACDDLSEPAKQATPPAKATPPTPTPTPGADADAQEDEAPGFVDDPAELGVDPAIAAQAKILWETRCAPCHGPYGDGKGPAGAALDPPPRNFHEGKWQAAAADAHIKKVILEGGPSSGLSPAMTAHLELRDRPELLEQLVIILRGLPHWKPAPEGSLTPEGAPAHTPIKEP